MCAAFLLAYACVCACGAAGVAPAPNVGQPAQAVAPTAAADPSAPSATAPANATPVAPAPQAVGPAPAASAEPAPPCVDGDVVMGTCICREKGKTADATGHCVYPPCPKIAGGAAFRDETTGQCMECRAGLKRTKDGGCAR